MEHIDNLYNSVAHYFNVLEEAGYYNSSDVKKLIIYLFTVNDIFDGPLSRHFDDNGLRAFDNVLRCISRSTCFVVSPDNAKLTWPRSRNYNDKLRVTLADMQRITEVGLPRKTEPEQ